MNFYKTKKWPLAFLLTGAILVPGSEPVMAQNASTAVDATPPVIELEELADGVADNSQVFTVQIAEDTELQDATLYHRRSGQEPYTAAPMQALGNSGLYTVTVNTDSTDLRAIEYYIQARDTSGNRTVSGFAFDPYSRSLAPALAIQSRPPGTSEPDPQSGPEPIAITKPFYKKRWFQVTVGVLAVGALASSLDSDDDDTQLVPLTINLE